MNKRRVHVSARPHDHPLVALTDVGKTFSTPDGELRVLEDVSMEVRRGEIVALLGKSGSGKSTLLRCIAGLVAPSSGTVSCGGVELRGANPTTAMVFQSFALLPWLSVLQNVELGLEAKGVGRVARRDRALRAIDLIGLDGFESAYPKELSGGMRQRVGFARALVVEPQVLLMDEPFSALDVLTAENLRGELLELWASADLPIQAIVLVTHNIEEAVLLADRIVILDSKPGRIRVELAVDLARPRDRHGAAFQSLVDQVYGVMIGRPAPGVVDGDTPISVRSSATHPLPHASVDGLSGFAEILVGLGPTSIAVIGDELGFEVNDLLPLVDALDLLGFATVDGGCVGLTATGRTFAGADIQVSKRIFAGAILERAPLVRSIVHAIDRTEDGKVRAGLFRHLLRRNYSTAEVDEQLEIAVDWGRYGEQFGFDADRDELTTDPDRIIATTATTATEVAP